MRRPLALATAALLGAALLAQREAAAQQAPAEGLPGVDTGDLTPAQVEVVREVAKSAFCHCGCPHTLEGCLRQHTACKHAPRQAALAVRLAGRGLPSADVQKAMFEYYASFDRSHRAKLDVSGWGPALGEEKAPVTIVEFSDFTCPYCQKLRPVLERFVKDHAGRVRLFYKPFPIASHARAKEAALAAEWARERGVFWRMHDRLFDHPHALGDEDLVGHAEALGADGADLRKALGERRGQARLTASQQEARAAGLQGTPTLFLNGRRLSLGGTPEEMPDLLEFTLEDEEEWSRHAGWEKD